MNPHQIVIATPDVGAMESEADATRDIRSGTIIAVMFFILFLGWATFFRLDAAAYAVGSLKVSGQLQTVQHRDGGNVSAIFVKEGQRVSKGQILVELSAPEARAQERALQAQAIALLAQRGRLEAELGGNASIVVPAEFGTLRATDKPSADAALRRQTVELVERRAVLSAQRDVLRQRVVQTGQQGQGNAEQRAATDEQIRLFDEQLAALKPLEKEGFVSTTRIREMERARAQLTGQRGQYSASVAQAQSGGAEFRLQILEGERQFHERSAAELRDVETRLGDIMPKLEAARNLLALSEIRAPATGVVVGLTVFTPGGVIAPGQRLMNIVPDRWPLLIEARISPNDADDLFVGARTLVKFTGLHERSLPDLKGTLTRLSADSFTDEKSGISYFVGEVSVPASELNLIKAVRGKSFALRAGMPVEILIPLRTRTALDYLLEPLVGSFWASFREH